MHYKEGAERENYRIAVTIDMTSANRRTMSVVTVLSADALDFEREITPTMPLTTPRIAVSIRYKKQ
jgi:Ni,Fe-hydrogenase III component G